MTEELHSRRRFDDISWKILGWLMDALALGLVAVTINLHLRIMNLELWQSATTANRYTSQDHLIYAAKQSEEINRLWLKISDMQASWLRDISEVKTSVAVIPQLLSTPPIWWTDYAKPVLEDHGTRIKTLETNINRRTQ